MTNIEIRNLGILGVGRERIEIFEPANDNLALFNIEGIPNLSYIKITKEYSATDNLLEEVLKLDNVLPVNFQNYFFLGNRLDKTIRHVFWKGNTNFDIIFWSESENCWMIDTVKRDFNLLKNHRLYVSNN